MKIPAIRNCSTVKFIKSLYYANRPMPIYKPMPQRMAFLRQDKWYVTFMNMLKKILY